MGIDFGGRSEAYLVGNRPFKGEGLERTIVTHGLVELIACVAAPSSSEAAPFWLTSATGIAFASGGRPSDLRIGCSPVGTMTATAPASRAFVMSSRGAAIEDEQDLALEIEGLEESAWGDKHTLAGGLPPG